MITFYQAVTIFSSSRSPDDFRNKIQKKAGYVFTRKSHSKVAKTMYYLKKKGKRQKITIPNLYTLIPEKDLNRQMYRDEDIVSQFGIDDWEPAKKVEDDDGHISRLTKKNRDLRLELVYKACVEFAKEEKISVPQLLKYLLERDMSKENGASVAESLTFPESGEDETNPLLQLVRECVPRE